MGTSEGTASAVPDVRPLSSRERDKIETRVARVGGELSDLLAVVRECMPDEYPALLAVAQTITDETRRVRRVAGDRLAR